MFMKYNHQSKTSDVNERFPIILQIPTAMLHFLTRIISVTREMGVPVSLDIPMGSTATTIA